MVEEHKRGRIFRGTKRGGFRKHETPFLKSRGDREGGHAVKGVGRPEDESALDAGMSERYSRGRVSTFSDDSKYINQFRRKWVLVYVKNGGRSLTHVGDGKPERREKRASKNREKLRN